MEVNQEIIKKVAKVARLQLDEKEIDNYVNQLKELLEHFAIIKEADVDAEKPSFHPINVRNQLREDKEGKSLTQEQALKNSKFNQDGYIKGPKAV